MEVLEDWSLHLKTETLNPFDGVCKRFEVLCLGFPISSTVPSRYLQVQLAQLALPLVHYGTFPKSGYPNMDPNIL